MAPSLIRRATIQKIGVRDAVEVPAQSASTTGHARLQQLLDVADRVQGTAIGSIRVLLPAPGRASKIASRTNTAAICATRSLIVGTPGVSACRRAWVSTPDGTPRDVRLVLQLFLEFVEPSFQPVRLDVLYSGRATPPRLVGFAALVGESENIERYTLS